MTEAAAREESGDGIAVGCGHVHGHGLELQLDNGANRALCDAHGIGHHRLACLLSQMAPVEGAGEKLLVHQMGKRVKLLSGLPFRSLRYPLEFR